MHSHLGVLGVTGFLMKDLTANPLDYVEGGPLNERRRALSEILDSTNPDLGAFARRGGKMIVTIGTNDTLASPGAQLDYYQSVIDKMGRAQVDRFARFFVMPQTGHGLSGTNYGTTATGRRSRSRRCRTPWIVSRCCSTGSSAAWRPACRSRCRPGRRACRSVRIRRIRSTSAGRKRRRHRIAARRPDGAPPPSHTAVGINRSPCYGPDQGAHLSDVCHVRDDDRFGLIIPEIVKTFHLTLTAAGTFQYATMAGIALAGLGLGTLADRLGHRRTIVIGLTVFAAASFLFAAGDTFLFFVVLMGLSGIAIGVFKTGALALIGDISTSTAEHTSIMNTVEGFFGIGSIVGPAVLALSAGERACPWKWLYVIAGSDVRRTDRDGIAP